MNTLLTLEEFRAFSPSSSLTDSRIEIYLQIATEILHEYAGVSLEEGEITEILKGNNQNILFLKKRPVKSIIECSSNKNENLLNSISINLSNSAIIRHNGVFFQGQDIDEPYLASDTTRSEIVKVKYKGGFVYPSLTEKGDVPYSLKYALVGLIEGMTENIGDGTGKLKSYSRDDVSYTFRDKIERDNEFYKVISKYISW